MKILYVTTVSETMGFFTFHINMLLEQGHTVDMACNVIKPVNQKLIERGCNVYNMEFQRSPLKRDNYSAYKKLKKLIMENNYDIVHTHTPIASVCARLACKSLDKVKVIYTAHGFHFFKGAPLKNWLMYYPVERWLARYTDMLITINKEDYARAQTFKARKVAYIPGVGLDTKKFSRVNVDKSAKRRELGVPDDAIVLLSVGELNKNKNHETVIKAVAKLNNPNVYYIICGNGSRKYYLNELAKKLGLEKQVKLLGFRKDIAEICKSVDIFAFPSNREGLGMAALEAMAAGLPIVTANIHGIVDYSVDGINGYTCSPKDVDGFAKNIDKLLICTEERSAMAAHNVETAKAFDINNVGKRMQEIYSGVWLDKA